MSSSRASFAFTHCRDPCRTVKSSRLSAKSLNFFFVPPHELLSSALEQITDRGFYLCHPCLRWRNLRYVDASHGRLLWSRCVFGLAYYRWRSFWSARYLRFGATRLQTILFWSTGRSGKRASRSANSGPSNSILPLHTGAFARSATAAFFLSPAIFATKSWALTARS